MPVISLCFECVCDVDHHVCITKSDLCLFFSAMLPDMFSCSMPECHSATLLYPVLVSEVDMRQNMSDFIFPKGLFFLKISGETLKYKTLVMFHLFWEK